MQGPHGRAAAEQRLLERLEFSLTEDVAPMLPAGVAFDDDEAIATEVTGKNVEREVTDVSFAVDDLELDPEEFARIVQYRLHEDAPGA